MCVRMLLIDDLHAEWPSQRGLSRAAKGDYTSRPQLPRENVCSDQKAIEIFIFHEHLKISIDGVSEGEIK